MNIYLCGANETKRYFPQHYYARILERIWDFSKPSKIFDIDHDNFQEESLLIIQQDYLFSDFCYENNQINFENKKTRQLRSITNKKILIDFSYKNLHSETAKFFIRHYTKLMLEACDFLAENVYYFVQTKKDAEILKECLQMDINICYADRWLQEVYEFIISKQFQTKLNLLSVDDNPPKKKFSIFIRRFECIRFHVFCELLAKNLLGNFHYTFCGYSQTNENYNETVCTDMMHYVDNLPAYFFQHKDKIIEWVKNMPHTFSPPVPNYDHLYSPDLGPYYNTSDIHIVHETHETDILSQSNWSVLTEKTYKAILYKKPFIIISQPYILQYLRDCGYKTFASFIDESYDNILDTHERIRAIVNEIERINNLPKNDYDNLLINCQDAVEHNYELLLEEANKPVCENFLIKNIRFI
jgi:hypothetical protein